MSNFIYNVDYKTTGYSYHKYNSDIQLKGTFNDFVLPSWTVENFNQNEAWKARYLLTYSETYEDLTEEQKEKLREEVFESWGQTIWGIIRQRFGLVLDRLGWNYLSNNVKQNLYLALSYQINNWRVNLPYEINNNINRVSGNLQTTINASAFETGFDALGEQTKTALTATGLDTYDYESLLNKVYREDTLAIEVEDTKDRLSALEQKTSYDVPDNLITRVEASNLYERIGKGYITKTEAENTYVKTVNLASLTTGGYFQNENKVSDSTTIKSLKDTGSKELKIETSIDSITYQFLNNNNVERSFILNRAGLLVDNQAIPSTNSILSSIRNIYYDKTDIDSKLSDVNEKITNEDTKIKEELRNEISDTYHKKTESYSKSEIDNQFFNQKYIRDNFYNKADVDTKITAAQTGGQVDLSNYYNKNQANTLFNEHYTKHESDYRLTRSITDFLSKKSNLVQEIHSNTSAPLFIITGNPAANSNNAARMEDVVSEVKRLFIEAITEYDKTSKKEYTNIQTFQQFHTLEGDDEEIIITIKNKQIIIDAANISSSDLLVYTYTYYVRDSNGNDIKYIQKISLRKVNDKIDFISNETTENIGPAGIGISGARITEIDKVEIRKDSVRGLVNSLQKIT